MLLLAMILPLAIFAVIAVYFISLYNGLVSLKNSSAAAWHQIDVQLTRRADLVGNLVETVRGYAAHEKTVLEDVTSTRASVKNSRSVQDAGKALSDLDQALMRLFAVAENYPTLKADANFRVLQAQLQEIENSLASARQSYNDVVRRYNTACESFPAGLFASTFGFAAREYFEAAPAKTEPPRVSFA
jgi:LemA protein